MYLLVIPTTIIFLFSFSAWRHLFNRLLSSAINWYLIRRHDVRHMETGAQIPTCPYVWPTGQSVSGKFLEGEKNSANWRREHGGIFRIWAGTRPEIVLTKPRQMKLVFRDSDKHPKAENNDAGYLMGRLLGKCVGLLGGEEWRHLRNVSEKAFTRTSAIGHVSMIYDRAKKYVKNWEETGTLGAGTINPVEDIKMLPFFAVADITFGPLSPDMEKSLWELAPGHEKLFKEVFKAGCHRFSLSRFFPTDINRTLHEFETKWKKFNLSAYQRAVNNGLVNTPVYQLFEELATGSISPENVYQTLDEALYANLDVTTGALSWNLVFLAFDPKIQAQARAEIRAVDKSNPESLHKYLLDTRSFLSACINEAARLKPLAPFSVPQAAPTERVLDGYRIPAGTHYLIDAYALNIKNDFWGEDAEKYRPGRFQEVSSTEVRYNFWRFGFGPRQCMGRYVADVVIRGLLVELLDRWELQLPKGMSLDKWERDMETWVNHPTMDLITVPLSGEKKVL